MSSVNTTNQSNRVIIFDTTLRDGEQAPGCSMNEVAKRVKNATVASLARATRKDIDRAAEAIKPAQRQRIHTFIATSPLHMQHKLQMAPSAVLEAINDAVSHDHQCARYGGLYHSTGIRRPDHYVS